MNMGQLIKSVDSGQSSFGPADDSGEALSAFQLTALLILKGRELGYLSEVITHQESDSGNDYYDSVVVVGITKKGRTLLA